MASINSLYSKLFGPTDLNTVATSDPIEIKYIVPADVRDNEPTVPGDWPGSDELSFTVKLDADDRTTVVEIFVEGESDPVGTGVARRRKGERRNPALGVALAAARAFRDASEGYAEYAEGLLK